MINVQQEFFKMDKICKNIIKDKTDKTEFERFLQSDDARWAKISYEHIDLVNALKTTDTFIDKFLPFRLFKEMSVFLEEVMDKESVRQLKRMERGKMKALYDQLFLKDEEIPDFKKKMNDLQSELGFRVEGTREKEAKKINKMLKERNALDQEKR